MTKGMKRGLAALAILLLLPAALLLTSPWWLPRVALPQINQQLQHYSRVPASLGSLRLQLWPLRLELGQLRLGDWQQPILALEQASLQLEPLALAEGVLHIQQLQLGGLRSHLQLDSEGRLNLLQALRLPPPQPPSPADSSPPPALRIDQLLIDGQLQLSDQRLQQPLELAWPHMRLHVRDLDTRGGAARLWLALHGPQVPALSLHSQFDPQARSASGRARLAGLDLQPLTRYLQPMALRLGRGQLTLDSQFSLHDSLQLSQGSLELRDLQLDEDAGHRLQLPHLSLHGLQLDSATRQLQIGRLDSRGLITRLTRQADGRLDWQQLVQDSLAAAAPRALPLQLQTATTAGVASEPASPAPASPAGDTPPDAARPWQLVLQQLQLSDYRLALTDQSVQPAARLDIGPLNLQAGPLHADLSQPLQLQLDSAIGPRGQLALSGSLQPASRSADLQLRLDSLDLRPLQGWISPWIRVQLQAGDLDTQLAIQAAAPEGAPLQLQASGSAAINQLHIKDGIEDRDLLKWQRLSLGALQYHHGTRLQIGSIELEKPYARLVLDEQRRSNIQALLVEQPAATTTAGTGSASAPLHVQIGSTRVADGTVNFADRSLTPNFAASILQLEGRIGALDNRSSQAAAIDIRGKVDRYAPVRIHGSLTPFDPLQRLDVTTSFRRVELTTLTPYSGKFAGYSIRKGRLNLDLHYRIDRGQLQADNKLVLENLQLGDRVESPDATSLPVRLAVALLKDSQGRIDIELPVSGDLNNPQFSIGPLLAQTLGNLIARAAKAPFNLLLGLAEDSGSADQIGFAAAATTLDEPARQRLDQLASALTERPELRLEVEGLSAASLDGPQLAEARLQREYQRLWYRMQQERGAKVPARHPGTGCGAPDPAGGHLPHPPAPGPTAGVAPARPGGALRPHAAGAAPALERQRADAAPAGAGPRRGDQGVSGRDTRTG